MLASPTVTEAPPPRLGPPAPSEVSLASPVSRPASILNGNDPVRRGHVCSSSQLVAIPACHCHQLQETLRFPLWSGSHYLSVGVPGAGQGERLTRKGGEVNEG